MNRRGGVGLAGQTSGTASSATDGRIRGSRFKVRMYVHILVQVSVCNSTHNEKAQGIHITVFTQHRKVAYMRTTSSVIR